MTMKIDKGTKKTTKIKIKNDEIQTAVGKIVTQHSDGSAIEENEEVGTVHGLGPFANVGVSASRTFNLGDYNSAKIEVSLHVPCVITEKEIDDTYAFCYGWVEQKMAEAVESLTK